MYGSGYVQSCTSIGDGKRFQILIINVRGIVNRLSNTKALTSYADTKQMIGFHFSQKEGILKGIAQTNTAAVEFASISVVSMFPCKC